MDEVLHIALGAGIFLAVNGALMTGAHRVASILPEGLSGPDRLISLISIAAIQIVLVTVGAGALGILGTISVCLGSIVLSFVLLTALHGHRRTPWLKEMLSDAVSAIREEPLTAVAAIPGIAAMALVFMYALPRPPLGFDPLNYHLTIAANAIQHHDFSILFFPPYFDLYSYFPANGDAFSIWAILPFGCDLLLPLVNVPFVVMLVLSLYSIARSVDVGRAASVAATSALTTLPMMFMLVTESYVEVPLWALFFAAVRLCMVSAAGRTAGVFLVAAGLCGLMVGTKTTGILMAALAFGVHAMLSFPPGKSTLRCLGGLGRRLLIMGGAIGLIGSYFYFRNLYLAGNPIYPYPVRLFGTVVFPGQGDLDIRLAATSLWTHLDYLWYSGKLSEALVGEVFGFNSSWGLGPTGLFALFVGAPLGIVACGSAAARFRLEARRLESALFIAGALVLLAYLFMPYSGKFLYSNTRFAYPGAVLLALTAIGMMTRSGISNRITAALFLMLQAATFPFTNIPITKTAGLVLAGAAALTTLFTLAVMYLRDRGTLKSNGSGTTRKALVWIGVVAISLFALASLHHVRERDRVRFYREADEPYRLMVSYYAPCLAAVEHHLPEGRLAIALEARRRGFLFPMFGSHLTREIMYVNIGQNDGRYPHMYPFGNPRMEPDAKAWYRHMMDARPDALLTFPTKSENEIPVESFWARDRLDVFDLVFESNDCELFLIDTEKLARIPQ